MLRPVTKYESRRGTFEVMHDDMHCRPWGLFVVRLRGETVGRQLSYPDRDDCESMARPEPPPKRRDVLLHTTPLSRAWKKPRNAANPPEGFALVNEGAE